MAPSQRNDHKSDEGLREDMFGNVRFLPKVPSSYVSLRRAEREYNVGIQDFEKVGIPSEGLAVIKGKQNGHLGIYVHPDFLHDVRNSKTDEIAGDHLSEKYLERCLERKNGFAKGWVKSYRESDPDSTQASPRGWATFGQKKGQRGPLTWFYPKSFVKHKAKMDVLPAGSLTELEVHHKIGAALRSGATPIHGIRPDIPGAPDYFYLPTDILPL